MSRPTPRLAYDRWAEKVDRNGPIPAHRPDLGPCWLWLGAVDHTKYGRFKGEGRKVELVHRWTYEHFVGPIPAGLTVDHLCLNTICVNHAHFEIVTRQVNASRGNPNTGKTHCGQGHEFTESNTYIKPNGNRDCRTCRRAHRLATTARRLAVAS